MSSFSRLLRNIVLDNKVYQVNTISVDIEKIPVEDKRLILSHILSPSEQEYAFANPTRMLVVYNENRDYIQDKINETCDEVYADMMEEAGLTRRIHADNGEVYYA